MIAPDGASEGGEEVLTDAPPEQVARSTQSQRDRAARILAMWAEVERGWRPLLRVVRAAVRLAWVASRSRLILLTGLSVVTASGLTTQVLAGRSAFELLLTPGGVELGAVAVPLLVVGGVATVLKLASAVTSVQSIVLNMRMQEEAEAEVLQVAATVPLEVFEDSNFHENLQRASLSVTGQNELVSALVGLTGGLLSVLAMGSLLATIRPALLPLMIAATALEMWLAARAARESYAAYLRLVEVDLRSRAYRGAICHPWFVQDVHAYDLLEHLDDQRLAAERHQIAETSRVSARNTRRTLLGAAGAGLCTVAAVALLFAGVRDGSIGLPAAAAAAYAFVQGRRWLQGLGNSVNRMYESAVMLGAYEAFVRLGREVGAARPDVAVPGPFKRLSVREVSFSYPGAARPALDGVSLDIARGEVVALVGENGSGKTTLAKVLANLYTPTSGQVLWDGLDISTCDPTGVRDHVAVIFQDYSRYWLTARENIGLGRWRGLDDTDRLYRAAEAAGIHDVLAGLSHGYDTYLTNQLVPGTDLSGGQWQRVALARGFFRDADLLVLDEPTSALDARAERDLFDRMRDLTYGRTVLLISHRFSTVRNADRIFVLHEGKVVEQGSHEELMRLDGRYAELFTIQASAYRGDAATPVDEDRPSPAEPPPAAVVVPAPTPTHAKSDPGLRDRASGYLDALGDEKPPGWRQFPRLAYDSVRLCFRSGPVRFPAMLAMTVIASVAVAVQVPIARRLARLLFTGPPQGFAPAPVASALLWLAALSATATLCRAVVNHHAWPLGSSVLAHGQGAVLRVGGAVPLEVHEDPRYFARQNEAIYTLLRTSNSVAIGTTGLVGNLVGSLILGSLLLAAQPALLPILLAGSMLEVWLRASTTKHHVAAQRELTPTRQRLDIIREMLTKREHAKEVHSFDLHDPLAERWRALSRLHIAAWANVHGRTQRLSFFHQLVGGAVSAIGLVWLIVAYADGRTSLAAATASAFAFQQARIQLGAASNSVITLTEAAAFHHAYWGFLRVGERLRGHRRGGTVPTSFERLTLRDVCFTYPTATTPALDGVSSTIRKGQVVALVGENGSGKTTLAKVLSHLYAPTSGQVLWDDVDTATCEPVQVRSHAAVVFQDFHPFEVPVRANIAFGDLASLDDIDRVRRAAEAMGIDGMIRSLPSGYDTILSPRMGDGVDLSGGQKQRVTLARAFFREPLLLILDEPTSALDAKAEKKLFDQIQALAADRTVLFVSHRFTTVRNADHIIVLHQGRVVEQGTHAELLANRGQYHELFTLQAAAYLEPSSDH